MSILQYVSVTWLFVLCAIIGDIYYNDISEFSIVLVLILSLVTGMLQGALRS